MASELTDRQRRWLDALLVLGTLAVGFVVVGQIGTVFFWLGDVILVFFLAWLIAFILSPVVAVIVRLVPRLPRVAAVVLVYGALLAAFVVLTILVADNLAGSITEFVRSVPQLREDLPALLRPWQERLTAIGLGQVDLGAQANTFIDNLSRYGTELVGPLQQVAVASLGVLGNVLIVLILSLYIVIDRDRILSFLLRLVPPGYKEEARLLETSIARSFGGFIRGQAAMGITYGFVALVTSAVLNLPYLPVTTALAGIAMAIPFFGPFVAWAPPVIVAIVLVPEATLPALLIMGVGWFLVMNVLQPRVMQEAVGIHPIVVLGSVLVGSKVAGITGAIFGIPVAAVLSAFFFHFVGQAHVGTPVAARAARRLEAREGRTIRVPREPAPGVDPDLEDAQAIHVDRAHAHRPARPHPAAPGPAEPGPATSPAPASPPSPAPPKSEPTSRSAGSPE